MPIIKVVNGRRVEMSPEEEAEFVSNQADRVRRREEEFVNTAGIDIDLAAEQIRGKFLTPGSGQAISYLQKALFAREILNRRDNIAPGEYPNLDPLVGLETDPGGEVIEDIKSLAEMINAKYMEALTLEGSIDSTRRRAKIAIEAARGDYAKVKRIHDLAMEELSVISQRITNPAR